MGKLDPFLERFATGKLQLRAKIIRFWKRKAYFLSYYNLYIIPMCLQVEKKSKPTTRMISTRISLSYIKTMKLELCKHWCNAFYSGKALTIQALHYRTLFFALERESFHSTWNIFALERESFHSTGNIFALERESLHSRIYFLFCSGTRKLSLDVEHVCSGTGKLSLQNIFFCSGTWKYFLWNVKAFIPEYIFDALERESFHFGT